VQALEDAYDLALRERGLSEADPQARAVRWMLEELRVSLFAQSLRTPVPVSEKRVRTALQRGRARLDEQVPPGGRR